MKAKIGIGILLCSITSFGQTKIEKVVPVKSNQSLVMSFDYPEVIKLQTWDKSEILVKGVVSINRGENDDAFELVVANEGNTISISSLLKDKENIPQRIMIKKDDQEYFFKAKDYNDPEVQKFLEDNGREYAYMSNGIIKEIELEVFVPKGMATKIEAKYGLVEVTTFEAPLTVDAKYGGVDATINVRAMGELTARTRYGEILTNLDIKFDSGDWTKSQDKPKWTEISAKPGTGLKYMLESKYGKVYLRKPKI